MATPPIPSSSPSSTAICSATTTRSIPSPAGRYYIPASGSVMRFRRTSDGIVDAIVTVAPWDSAERVLLKLPGRQ